MYWQRSAPNKYAVQLRDEDVCDEQPKKDECKHNSGNMEHLFAAALFRAVLVSAAAECGAQARAFLLHQDGCHQENGKDNLKNRK